MKNGKSLVHSLGNHWLGSTEMFEYGCGKHSPLALDRKYLIVGRYIDRNIFTMYVHKPAAYILWNILGPVARHALLAC